jgi:hypothetical protein
MINAQSIMGLGLEEIENRLQGSINTTVRITCVRDKNTTVVSMRRGYQPQISVEIAERLDGLGACREIKQVA